MLFRNTPKVTKSDMLSAKPVRSPDAKEETVSATAWRLTVPLRPRRWANFILRVPSDLTRTFELDELGKFVWDQCDGKTSVRQIIRKLAKRYNLNEREAEVSTVAFLQSLTKRGLIGLAVVKKKARMEDGS